MDVGVSSVVCFLELALVEPSTAKPACFSAISASFSMESPFRFSPWMAPDLCQKPLLDQGSALCTVGSCWKSHCYCNASCATRGWIVFDVLHRSRATKSFFLALDSICLWPQAINADQCVHIFSTLRPHLPGRSPELIEAVSLPAILNRFALHTASFDHTLVGHDQDISIAAMGAHRHLSPACAPSRCAPSCRLSVAGTRLSHRRSPSALRHFVPFNLS